LLAQCVVAWMASGGYAVLPAIKKILFKYNRVCVLANLQGLEQDPWRDFYRTLLKTSAAVAK
jgi:hypothetical protein